MDQFKWSEREKLRREEKKRRQEVMKLQLIKQRFAPEQKIDWVSELRKLMEEMPERGWASRLRDKKTKQFQTIINHVVHDELYITTLEENIHGTSKQKGGPDD